MERLIVGALFTYCISWLLTTARGPFDIFGKLRDVIGITYDQYSNCTGENELALAVCCIKCTSLYIGVGTAVAMGWRNLDILFYGLAFAAATMMINRWVAHGTR